MNPRQAPNATPRTDPVTSPLRGASAARARWIASHDPTLRERLEVAAAHLRLARQAAAAGVAGWILRREVTLADREILLARRSLASARKQASRRDAAQSRMIERVARAAAELHRSTRAAARLLDAPLAAGR